MTCLLRDELRAAGAFLDGIYYCLHHPAAVAERYRVECQCRKPRPGLLLQAGRDLGLSLEDSYMVGDLPTDVSAGKAVGCTTVLISAGGPSGGPASSDLDDRPDCVTGCLLEAAKWIQRVEPRRIEATVAGRV
jgi:D-glycero-D-manno-heptose 1,7-bisphosphate phosphatase